MSCARILFLTTLVAVASRPAAGVTEQPSRGCGAASVEKGPRLERTIDVGDTTRKYILHVPESVDATKPAPLLLDFHGWGHSAAGVWNVSGFKDLAEREGFITAYPDGLPVQLLGKESRPGWQIRNVENNRDVAFTTVLLDEIDGKYCIDRARVFVTGFSNGAFLSHLLGCVLSDRIAAIAPVGGGRITVRCEPGRRVPVLIYHGRNDGLIPPASARQARDTWAAINDCTDLNAGECDSYARCADGAEVRYCEVDIGHRWPPQATAEIWRFFVQHPMR